MPPTVHKVLIHGRQIVEHSVLPPGCLGEEGPEARNKIYKYDRQFHARKDSRNHNLQDIFNRAMETSDPLISSISLRNRIQKRKLKKLNLSAEVLSLLRPPSTEPEVTPTTSATIEESTDNEEDFNEDDEDNDDMAETLPVFRDLDNFELDTDEI
ncbi:uncharacterized protein LOC123989064 [Osmia bicornis bicornis]|uniref:uncharacterized protein LOC123989064 n=1 Tax=Osmia bicornis bicornis TaxID=1437191 RepID=UPI001EAEB5E1|nr:uncharacterized protein LOC123989064 [Osmia bicornis bicornis]